MQLLFTYDMEKKEKELIALAYSKLGTKWQHNQNSEYAVDCLRFWEQIIRKFKPDLEQIPNSYSKQEPIKKVVNYLNRNFTLSNNLNSSCLLLFDYSGYPHLGIMVGKDKHSWRFLHASYKQKKVVENRFSDYFQKHYVGCWKIFDD